MAKKQKKKIGAGAVFARIVTVILVMILGGVVSFMGSKTYFANKLKKDKKAEIAKQLKEESKERVDVGLIQAGKSMTLRIYHNKNQQIIFVPLRSDMMLDLNKKGKDAVETAFGRTKSSVTVSELIKATKDGVLMKQQVEKTLGISIDTYEIMTEKQLMKLMNTAGEINVDLDKAVTYEDQTSKTVTLNKGSNTLNGNAVLALMTDQTLFENEEAHVTLQGDILVAITKALKEKSLSEYKEYVSNYYDTVKSNTSFNEVEKYLSRIRGVKGTDINYKILDGTEQNGTFIVDASEAKNVFDQILSESGDLDAALATTTTAKKKSTKSSSKNVNIEIQNSTGITGLASRWKDKLSEDGYTIGLVQTNRSGALTHTKIIVAKKGLGKDLKKYFKNPQYQVGTVSSGLKICIIIGTEDQI